jgi:hypothetical protein
VRRLGSEREVERIRMGRVGDVKIALQTDLVVVADDRVTVVFLGFGV